MSNVTQNPVVESTKTKVEIKTAIENAVKTNQWREVNLLGIINEPLETEDYDVFVPKMGEILILKLKDDKDQWYFASTLRNTGTKGFIHVNAITIFGPNGTYREKRKREPLEKGLLLRTNKVLVKECGFSHWSIPMLDDSLGYDIAHSAWDVCNQDYKDLFINSEEKRLFIMDILSKMFLEVSKLPTNDQKIRSKIQERYYKGLEKLNCNLAILHRKGKQKGEVMDPANNRSLRVFKRLSEKHVKVEKAISLQEKRIKQKLEEKNKTHERRGIFIFQGQQREKKVQTQASNEAIRSSLSVPPFSQILFSIETKGLKMKYPMYLTFSLFVKSNNEAKFFTEEFMIEIPTLQTFDKVYDCMFKDLEKNLWDDYQIYLVARAYRYGPIKDSKKEVKEYYPIKKPLGIGIYAFSFENVEKLLDGSVLNELLTIYQCKDEGNFHNFHSTLIDVYNQNLTKGPTDLQDLPNMEKIADYAPYVISLSLFEGEYNDVIENEDLPEFVTPINSKKFLPVLPGDYERNDIYLTLNHLNIKGLSEGFFAKDNNLKNILIKVQIVTDVHKLAVIKPWVESDQGSDKYLDIYESTVHYHSPNPTWNETIKLNLSENDLKKAVIVFTFYSVQISMGKSIKPIGFTYLRLMENDLLLNQGNNSKISSWTRKVYKLPFDDQKYEKNIFEFDTNEKLKTKNETKSEFSFQTNVVSTIIPQTEYCRNLIYWEKVTKIPLKEILSHFFLDDSNQEKSIFLKENFIALLQILDKKGNDPEILSEVFKNISKIFDKFVQRFGSLIETKVEEMGMVYLWKYILNYLTKFFDEYKKFKSINDEFKSSLESLDSYLNIVVKSRLLYEKEKKKDFKEEDFAKDRKDFEDQLIKVLTRINELLGEQDVKLMVYNSRIVKHLSKFWEISTLIFPEETSAKFLTDFLQSIPQNKSVMYDKLLIIRKIVKGSLMVKEKSKDILFHQISQELIKYLENYCSQNLEHILSLSSWENTLSQNYKVLNLVIRMIGDGFRLLVKDPKIIKILLLIQTAYERTQNDSKYFDDKINFEKEQFYKLENDNQKKEKKSLIVKYIQTKKAIDEIIPLAYSAKVTFLFVLNDETLENLFKFTYNDERYLVEESSEENKETYLKYSIYDIFDDLQFVGIYRGVVPKPWILFHSFIDSALTNTFNLIKNWLIKNTKEKFDIEIWKKTLNVYLSFIRSDRLHIDHWTYYQKRILEGKEDFRRKTLIILKDLWNAMKDSSSEICEIVDDIFPLYTHISNQEFEKELTHFIYDNLAHEFQVKGNIKVTESKLQRNFSNDLTEDRINLILNHIEEISSKELVLQKVVPEFIHGIKELMKEKRDLELLKGDEYRTTEAYIEVMKKFLKHENMDLYYTYTHKLAEFHKNIGKSNYIESANCLLLHAERLDFKSFKVLEKFNDEYPTQKECERKESLYLHAVELYEKSNDFERALSLYKELWVYYETISYEYPKLEQLLTKTGKLYKQIIDTKRFPNSYFFVGKYGSAWGKEEGEYIYRGDVAEQILDFPKKIQNLPDHSDAKEKSKHKMDDTSKFIDIYTVFPCTEEIVNNDIIVANINMHPNISNYHIGNDVKIFFKKRIYDAFKDRVGIKKSPPGYNEYKNLHKEITYYYVKDNFPNNKRRQRIDVNNIKVVTLSPLEAATIDIEENVKKVTNLVTTFYKDAKKDTNQMSMLMKGVLSSDVNGGIKNYIKAFFSQKYINKANEKTLKDIARLRNALVEQLNIAKEALKVWKSNTSKATMPLVENLEEKWKEMNEQINFIQSLKLVASNTPIENDVDSDEELVRKFKVDEEKKKEDEKKKEMEEKKKLEEKKKQDLEKQDSSKVFGTTPQDKRKSGDLSQSPIVVGSVDNKRRSTEGTLDVNPSTSFSETMRRIDSRTQEKRRSQEPTSDAIEKEKKNKRKSIGENLKDFLWK